MSRAVRAAALIAALAGTTFALASGAGAGSDSDPVAIAAAQRPAVRCLNNSGTAYKAKVEPASCAHFGNGGTSAGGVNLKQIDWTNWGAKVARGEGIECGFTLPCAQIPVTVHAARKRRGCGRLAYTRLHATSAIGTTTVKTRACINVASASGRRGKIVYAAGDFTGSGTNSQAVAVRKLMRGADTILGLGDFQYDNISEIQSGWDKIYGPKPRGLFRRVRPTAGPSHDVTECSDTRYKEYFGRGAFKPYSFNRGRSWHLISLPSAAYRYGCNTGKVLSWLKADLAADSHPCTLAFWHEPFWTRPTSAHPERTEEVRPWIKALYAEGAELVLSAHQHNYQRFAEQNPAGVADPGRGLRQIVVGTGGIGLYDFKGSAANLEASNDTTFGALKLTLTANAYRLKFRPGAGGSFTDGPVTTSCHKGGKG